ncbi:MAG TPA: hypothetical protein VMW56_02495, partial [Candidatus Margulisiibacteriota bacterium]|nr:hypothetical protein [Candidatus Margulisiibacteriota bacterium]
VLESGECYEQVQCEPLPFATHTTRAFCCHLTQLCLSCPFTWCADGDIDPSTGVCSHCVHPCL